MQNIKHVTDDLIWVGANDRRLAMFEGVYSVPKGVSYNSYLLKDKKTVLFDTVDKAVNHRFIENLLFALDGRVLDYLVVQHMEPDHSAGIYELICRFPGMTIVCNAMTLAFIKQFFDTDIKNVKIVTEGEVLNTGKHNLNFIMAPMVHWPEVMVTYDSTDKILFSADAFGAFGALNGAIFSDEVDFERDYLDEARRYYANIVGKYGTQVQMLLKKASGLEINMICPLHGFVWRKNIKSILTKYIYWSTYEPEEKAVMIAYASVYGNTENAAEILSANLRNRGVKTTMFDVSVTAHSEIVAAAFKYSHLVFASTTYNAGIFVTMEALIADLVSHNIQNRTIAIIENGSWAATSGGLIREKFSKCKNINFIDNIITIKSSVKKALLEEINTMAEKIAEDFYIAPGDKKEDIIIDKTAMFKLSYGLFVLSTRHNNKDNGCIINTAMQLTDTPLRISVTVNKANLTHDMIAQSQSKEINISILTEDAPFSVYEKFGFASGKNVEKFDNSYNRTKNGVCYISNDTNAVISAKVTDIIDLGTHSLFIADVTQLFSLSNQASVTYDFYFKNVKPKPQVNKSIQSGYVCKICSYIYEGDSLPDDYICPLCKHGAADFEKI